MSVNPSDVLNNLASCGTSTASSSYQSSCSSPLHVRTKFDKIDNCFEPARSEPGTDDNQSSVHHDYLAEDDMVG
jgi:hypothetical protein